MSQYEEILNKANKLSESERIRLLSDLFESINVKDFKKREKLWAKVAESRLNEYDEGNIKSEDWEDIKKGYMY